MWNTCPVCTIPYNILSHINGYGNFVDIVNVGSHVDMAYGKI